MRHANMPMIESLESRQFLSASTLVADQALLQTDITNYAVDRLAATAAIKADAAAVKADGSAKDPNTIPLRNKFKQDLLSRQATLSTDRTNLVVAVNADRIVVLQDHQQIRTDKDDPTALAADKVKLNADQLKEANDRSTFATKLINDNLSTRATDLADRNAIVAQLTTDKASPTLIADKQKLITDTANWATTLGNDRSKIVAQRLVVANDLHG